MLKLLAAARWLSTSQFHRRFFANSTLDAARKRLHKLAEAGYITKVQSNPMQEAIFKLGRAGKRWIEQAEGRAITLEREPPKQLAHFLGINDVRIAAELLDPPIEYFFACWELPATGWKHPIIPDAIFAASNRSFAVEFDRGQENLRFFLNTKITWYLRGLKGFPLHRVLIVADRQARLESLARAIGGHPSSVLLTRLDLILKHGFRERIFFETSLEGGIKLL